MADRLALDTSVLIDFRRDRRHARGYVLGLLGHDTACVHPVVTAELLDGVRDKRDLGETWRFLLAFRRLTVKGADFERCVEMGATPAHPPRFNNPALLIPLAYHEAANSVQ